MRKRDKAILLGNTLASGAFSALVATFLVCVKEINLAFAPTALFVIYFAHFILMVAFTYGYLAIPKYRHVVRKMNIRGYFMIPFGLVLSTPFFLAIILYVNEWNADQPIIRYGTIVALLAAIIPILPIWDKFGLSKNNT